MSGAHWRKYKQAAIRATDLANELTQKQMTAALDAELFRKGLTKTDSDNARLSIGYQTPVGDLTGIFCTSRSESEFTLKEAGIPMEKYKPKQIEAA